MFSGIVEEVGRIIEVDDNADGRCLKIIAPTVVSDLKIGDSVSVSGCCLTAVLIEENWFKVEVAEETLRRTKLGSFKKGSEVNLERAMKLSDRIGGHLVSGHIDAIAKITNIEAEGFSKMVTFAMPRRFAPLFIEKGSVAIDGVSLTVANVDPITDGDSPTFEFSVALIPHTLSVTTFAKMALGDAFNIETDMVARYVARWLAPSLSQHPYLKEMSLLDSEFLGCES